MTTDTKNEGVYEPAQTATHHNPYDTKVGGKPAATLADGTVPQTVKQAASRADGPAQTDAEDNNDDNDGVPTLASTVADIKAYLDAQGISYDGVTKKADLLALVQAE